jgi:hypothetical protein
MAFELSEYSPLYYTMIAKTDIPPVIIGKFVQIRSGSMEYLVLSPKDFTKYHANIVERFCLDKGIEGSYDPDRKRFDIYDLEWDIVGGEKSRSTRQNRPSGSSMTLWCMGNSTRGAFRKR